MKSKYTLLLLLFFSHFTFSQTLYFPPTDSDDWATISPESLGWCTDEIPALYEYLEEKNTKAFLVLKDGKIVLEQYFDTFTADSLWYWASAGKTITSTLTGIAQQEGMLSIDDPTSDYLGEGWTNCTIEQEAAITVWHQLTMTSGLDDGGDVGCTDPECLTYLADAGTRWSYHNAPYTLLTSVIEESSGLTINAFCNNYLEAPTGMSGFYLPVDDNTVYFSQPRDMARFGLLMLNDGYWDAEGVMTDLTFLDAARNTSQALNEAYGYLWWLNGKETFMMPSTETVFEGPIIPNAPDDMYTALGKNDQLLNIVPSQNLLVIRMGNNPGGIEDLVPTALNNTIWEYLNGIMCGVSSTEKSEQPFNLHLFPNPANDMVQIECAEAANYQILNLTGKVVQSGQLITGIQTLDVSSFESGVYLFRVETKNRTKTIRLVLR